MIFIINLILTLIMSRQCPICGGIVENDLSQFCIHCGKAFPEINFQNQLLSKINHQLIESSDSTDRMNQMIFFLTIVALCFTFITTIFGIQRNFFQALNATESATKIIENDSTFFTVVAFFIVFVLIVIVIFSLPKYDHSLDFLRSSRRRGNN
jgi:hypothetical protein